MKIPPVRVYFSESDQKDILSKIEGVLQTGHLTLGKFGQEFERKFAEYIDIQYAISVNSGTSAIEIPLRIFGIEGKEVLVPTNTFFATPAAVLHTGGRVKFVDADPQTFSVDVVDLRRKISKYTAGVIVVHIAGIITPQITEIQKICKENNLFLFEDAAHAHGSSLNGKMAGTFGDAAAFSFYPTKVITSAEGGMVVTNSEKIREETMLYRDQGKDSFTTNVHSRLGYNWRMSEIHAIIGLSQFKRLNQFVAHRRKIAKIYDKKLKEIPKIKPLTIPDGCTSNYYKYVAMLERNIDRTELKRVLREKYHVRLSGEVYELPCHLQPVFQRLCKGINALPQSEGICRRHICLPISAVMTIEEAGYVIDALQRAIEEINRNEK